MKTSTVVLTAAIGYVTAWLVGLFAAPARPATGGAAATRQYFLDHAGAAITQSLLVHGVAGLALGVFAVALSRLLAPAGIAAGTPRAVLVLGLAAATLSLIQVALLLSVATQPASLADQVAADRVQWIDYVDVAKLLTIAALAVVWTRAAATVRLVGSWVVPLAIGLAALLLLGGLSLVVDNGILTGALYVSLPLLLVWAGVVGASVYRATPASLPRAQ